MPPSKYYWQVIPNVNNSVDGPISDLIAHLAP